MPAKSSLYVADIALLHVILENPNCTKNDLWLPKGRGLWNKYLRESGLVRLGRCTVVKSFDRYNDSIATLRLCGYLKSETAHYCISDMGMNLFRSLHTHPSQWPLLIELDEHGNRKWETAKYFEKI